MHRTTPRPLRQILAAASTAVLTAAGLVAAAVPASAATTTPTDLLAQLVVAPENNSLAYVRALFGDWTDTNREGCNTRREGCKQESTVPVRQGSSSCSLASCPPGSR